MSLFGSSPDEPSLANQAAASEQRSLFDDTETPGAASHNSLFDDNAGIGPSPWNLPTPKKIGKSDLVKNLLPASAVPESYIDAFDILLESGHEDTSGSINLSGAKRIFEGTGLEAADQLKIINLITNQQEFQRALNRSEFNVLLALIGLSQEKEEATLDGVDERRKSKLRSFLLILGFRVVLIICRSSGALITICKTTEDCKSL